jgi:WhiB family redox-sensing transcriptional regulator
VVSHDKTPDYKALAAGLDRCQQVPIEVLHEVVTLHGLCLAGLWPEEEPDWDDCAPSDRTLAARLCQGCPVIDHCLELDLRTDGPSTTGVWGALPEDDRRTLHRVWQRRRQQHDGPDQEGGPTP